MLLTAGGVVSNVQLTGTVMPKTTVLKEKSPGVNVAVPALSRSAEGQDLCVTGRPSSGRG